MGIAELSRCIAEGSQPEARMYLPIDGIWKKLRNSRAEFAKSGKVVNAGLRYVTQTKSIILHSSLIEPAHKLIYLGKLII
jgi:hypothetical protein